MADFDVGKLKTPESLASRKHPSDGFQMLVDAGLADLTAEYIVLRYPTSFSADALRISKSRLEEHGIALPDPAT